MRSHIITLSSIVCFAATATTALAQDVAETKKKEPAPKLVVGASLGLSSSFFAPTFPKRNDYFKGTAGFFARYYLGKHLALETGMDFGHQERTYNGLISTGGNIYDSKTHHTTNTYTIPLQFQYHLLSPQSKLRPYFGVGVGLRRRDMLTTEQHPYNGELITNTYKGHYLSGVVSFTQGLTWQVHKRWQINQSLNIGRELRYSINSTDFKIGVGYNLFSK